MKDKIQWIIAAVVLFLVLVLLYACFGDDEPSEYEQGYDRGYEDGYNEGNYDPNEDFNDVFD